MRQISETPAGSRAPANGAQGLISKQVLYRRLEPMFATPVIGGQCHG